MKRARRRLTRLFIELAGAAYQPGRIGEEVFNGALVLEEHLEDACFVIGQACFGQLAVAPDDVAVFKGQLRNDGGGQFDGPLFTERDGNHFARFIVGSDLDADVGHGVDFSSEHTQHALHRNPPRNAKDTAFRNTLLKAECV